MRALKNRKVTEDEYLAAEEKSSVRHEYLDGYVFAMSGSTDAHNAICMNLSSVIHNHLRGGRCRVYASDMKLKIETARSYYYPDIMVSCEGFDAKSVYKENPVLLIEVLSPGTAVIDRREKVIAYQKIESLREYVIIHQDRQKIELFARDADGQWDYRVLRSGDDLLLESLPGQPFALSFGTIYEGYDPPCRVKESAGLYETATAFAFNLNDE